MEIQGKKLTVVFDKDVDRLSVGLALFFYLCERVVVRVIAAVCMCKCCCCCCNRSCTQTLTFSQTFVPDLLEEHKLDVAKYKDTLTEAIKKAFQDKREREKNVCDERRERERRSGIDVVL
jgi:hypothetical protein